MGGLVGRAAVLLLACASASLAAQAPPSPGTRSFAPEDFARFAPRNALDMLRQVPGFVIREAGSGRGLGEASGNVLINGRRLSAKSSDAATELGRIPADTVLRIDIVDGATLDIPGLSGQVANIVTAARGVSGQFSWRPEFRAHHADPLLTRFDASLTGRRGPVEYTLSLGNQGFRSAAGGPTRIFAPDGGFVELRDEVWTGNGEQPRIGSRFVYDGPGEDVGNLSLGYGRVRYRYDERGLRTGPALSDRDRRVRIAEDSSDYEIGGDYDLALGAGRLKLIGLLRGQEIPVTTLVRVTPRDGSAETGSRLTRDTRTSERIARAEYRWTAGGGDWQLSGEGAFNALSNVSRLFLLVPDREFDEVPLPGGSGRVEEARYEMIASHGRALSPRLTVQLSAGGEYSRLSQAGAGDIVRGFWRPKGQLSAAWKAAPRLDLNLKLQRRVGQLNFFDFLASVNLNEDRENAGNPDLVPQQSWEAEVEGVRDLGAFGTTTLRLYARLIQDIVDIVPIGPDGESVGNLDRASVIGAEWKSTVPLDPVGWRGGKLDARFQLQRSRVDDPLTGTPREISGALLRAFNIDLRHDVPGTDWAWGANLNHQINARNTRLTEVGRQWEGPLWASLYVEHKDVFGLTVRATAANLLDARSLWDRIVHDGRRTGPVAFFERRDRLIGPIFAFQVRGTF